MRTDRLRHFYGMRVHVKSVSDLIDFLGMCETQMILTRGDFRMSTKKDRRSVSRFK